MGDFLFNGLAKTTARQDKKHLGFGFGAAYIRSLTVHQFITATHIVCLMIQQLWHPCGWIGNKSSQFSQPVVAVAEEIGHDAQQRVARTTEFIECGVCVVLGGGLVTSPSLMHSLLHVAIAGEWREYSMILWWRNWNINSQVPGRSVAVILKV